MPTSHLQTNGRRFLPEEIDLLKKSFPDRLQHVLRANRQLTEEKEALRVSFEEMNELYEQAPCGYHSLDEQGIFVRVNQTLLNWLGYCKEDLLGELFTDFLPEADRPEFAQYLVQLAQTGKLHNGVFTMRNARGHYLSMRWISATALYDSAGHHRLSRFTVWTADPASAAITPAQQHTQADLLHLIDELTTDVFHWKHLNEQKSEYFDTATHELKNSLTAMIITSAMFKRHADNLTNKQVDYLHQLDWAAREMECLINNFLSSSRLGKGVVVNARPTDLVALLRKVSHQFAEWALIKDITLHCQLPAEPLVVTTDPACLSHIVENLLSNALKFSHRGKQVWIRARATADTVVVAVEDEGQGIAADEIPLLFRRFQSLSAQPTNGEVSTGLGLSIAQDFAHLLGGLITCQSTVGQGSTFTLTLPGQFYDS